MSVRAVLVGVGSIAVVFAAGIVGCDKGAPQEPAPPSPPAPVASSTPEPAPRATAEDAGDDAGRRDLSDGGYFPSGKNTKPQ